MLATACSDKDKYTVSGHIDGAEDKMLYLQRMDLNRTVTLDSVKVSGGDFKFKGERLTEPTFLILKLSDKNFITLLADSTENIVLNAEAQNLENSYKLKNSVGSVYIQVFNKRVRKLSKSLSSIISQYQAADTKDKDLKSKLEKEYTQHLDEHRAFVGEFIMENPRSFAGYYALFQKLDDNSAVLNVFDKKDQVYFSTLATSLNLYYPESERAKQLYNYVLSAKAQQQRQKLTQELLDSQGSHSGYIDIEAPNLDGDTIKLSSLEGKTIIVNFWASWDQKSMAANRQLKKVYKKYKSKNLEIYSVSLDKSKVLWETAIKTEEYPWVNVSDLQYTNSYPARLYNVKQLPANFIISSDGEIIGKDLFGTRLDDRLKDIF